MNNTAVRARNAANTCRFNAGAAFHEASCTGGAAAWARAASLDARANAAEDFADRAEAEASDSADARYCASQAEGLAAACAGTFSFT